MAYLITYPMRLCQRFDVKVMREGFGAESRMALPGIQAIFGFQLIAVFNSSFFQIHTPAEQKTYACFRCPYTFRGTQTYDSDRTEPSPSNDVTFHPMVI